MEEMKKSRTGQKYERYQQLTWGDLSGAKTCTQCYAVVVDTKGHDEWHGRRDGHRS